MKGDRKMKSGKKTEFAKFKRIMSKVKNNRPEVTATGKVQWGKSK